MKIGLYADPHFSQTSSIIVGRQNSFSGRLNNLIESFEWMNKFFSDNGVETVVCLGDMTDKPVLTAEEITAMSKCNLDDHWIVVGNHCRSDKDGKINSVSNYKNAVYEPTFITPDIFVLPYNHDVVDLKSLDHRPKIILSHNDLIGYDFGGNHISSEGYSISDILESCDLYINGHLHNGGWVVEDRIINLGCLSGMNFSSCGGEWEPSVAILDTDTLDLKLYENPKAYRFKKLEFSTLPKVKGFLDNLPDCRYVVQIKVPEEISDKTRKLLDQSDKIVASRVLTYRKEKSEVQTVKFDEITDSRTVYDKLKDFINLQSPKVSKNKIMEIIDKISKEEEGAI